MLSRDPIFRIHAELADIRHFGRTPYGERRVVDITGGQVEGPRLRGRVLPGADWQIVRPDGVTDIQARYGIETDAGARIVVASDGLRHGPRRSHATAGGRRGDRAVALLLPHRPAVRDRRPAPSIGSTASWRWGTGARARAVELDVYEVL